MADKNGNQHWLDSETFPCPHCGALLYRVVHSPMYDHWQLYCDSCANSVEVNYYDTMASALVDEISSDASVSTGERYTVQMRAIESALRDCSCGGRYQHDAPRRCHVCNTIVINDAVGIDLWPVIVDADEDVEPTPDQITEVDRFVAAHVRAHDIWQ
jgi:DNA-directed RNA polymerase subunit M/transcription elongation factor TFIIS